MPTVMCRICFENFPANKEENHSAWCKERMKIRESASKIDDKFFSVANQITDKLKDLSM